MNEDENNPNNESSSDRDINNMLAVIFEIQKQQKMIDNALKKVDIAANNFQGIVAQETRHAVTKATQEAFRESSRFMVEKAKELEALNKVIQYNLNYFRFKAIAVWVSISVSFFVAFFLLIMFRVPHLDEINRREDVLKKSAAHFQEKEGKMFVRIKNKKSCYDTLGTAWGDWCEVKPKSD